MKKNQRLLVVVLASGCCANSILEAQFPAEGYEYTSKILRSLIFDMSLFNGTVDLAENLTVRLPLNIANVKPSPELRIETDTQSHSNIVELSDSHARSSQTEWAASLEWSEILQAMAGTRGKKSGLFTPLGVVGFSTSGFQEGGYQWARRQLQREEMTVLIARAAFDFVEVFLHRPWKLYLTESFLFDFSLLPVRGTSWSDASEQDKLRYKLFFDAYGTHYVDAAKFGGSYESILVARSCDLELQHATSSAFKDCVSSKLSLSLSDLLPFLPDVSTEERSCQSFTSDSTAHGKWSFSQVLTRQKWEGGSLQEAPSLLSGNFSDWIQDVKSSPRSVPSSITSIPDLIRNIHTAFALAECIPCQQFQSVGLSKDSVAARLDRLDAAFTERLYGDLEDKLDQENECLVSCGGSNTCAGGEQQPTVTDVCTCSNRVCSEVLQDDRILDVHISKLNFRVRRTGLERSDVEKKRGWRDRLRLFAPDFDLSNAKVSTRDEFGVHTGFRSMRGSSVYIEVVLNSHGGEDCDPRLFRNSGCKPYCVGSINYDYESMGAALPLDGDCRLTPTRGKVRIRDAEVSLEGSVSYPYCCNCGVLKSDGDDLGGVTRAGLIVAILLPCLFAD